MSVTSRVLSTVAVAALGVAGAVLPGSPSFAAVPTCNAASPTTTASAVPIFSLTGPTWGTNWNCQLKEGNSGEGVQWLQEDLNRCYGAGISVDSSFGAHTRSALIAAQRRAGTSADGIYGPNTRKALVWFSYFIPGCEHAGV